MNDTVKTLAPGVYFDNHHGWHQSALIIVMAAKMGWDDPAYYDVIDEAGGGAEAVEAYADDAEDDILVWAQDAERYLSTFCPPGHYLGHLPDDGSWGVFPIEEDV